MDIDPNAKALLLGESAISDLNRHLPILFAATIYQDTTIRPSTVAVDDEVLALELRMRLYEKGFKQAFIRFYLPLKLVIFFRPKSWLLRIWEYVIERDRGAVGPQYSPVETPLLKVCGILTGV
jgi:hypothetical protein